MITVITGGSGSGKSAYAEDYTGRIACGMQKYYLATMQIFDAEGERKIKRHQNLRAGKQFLTIEQPVSIEESIGKMECVNAAVLLECMSNLVANEMFGEEIPQGARSVADKVMAGIERLAQKAVHLVIVTNNVFEDGVSYDAATMEYIEALGNINERMAAMADELIEVVVGIPVVVKKGNREWQ